MTTYTPSISALSSLLGRWAGGEGREAREAWAREAEERLELAAEEDEDDEEVLAVRDGRRRRNGRDISSSGSEDEAGDEESVNGSEDEHTIFPSSPVSIVRQPVAASTTAAAVVEVAHSPPVSGPLPEDDGNRDLRRRLHELASSIGDEKERARRMHELMTERYRRSRGIDAPSSNISSSVPTASAVLSTTPTNRSYLATPPPSPRSPGSASSAAISKSWTNSYIRPKLRPPQPPMLPADLAPSYMPESRKTLGCQHYQRKNKMQCFTCSKWYPCRLCHDAVEDHQLPRQQTQFMLCVPCKTVQPVAQDCVSCGERMAAYYCDKCKLWDSRKKNYHCDDCGICRIGEGLGKDFFHCKQCGTCLDVRLRGNHRCIERSTECDCPICGEFLFASREKVVFTACGHSIHSSCLLAHQRTSYKCPTCARTISNMTVAFRALTLEIERTPLPAPYSTWRSVISCNDCACRNVVPFHFLGHMCCECGSYNTLVKKVRREGEVEEEGNEVLRMLENARRAVGEVRREALARGVVYDDGWEGEESDKEEEEEDVVEEEEEGDGEGEEEEEEEDDDDDDDGLWGWGKSPRESAAGEEEDDDEDEEDPIFLIGHV